MKKLPAVACILSFLVIAFCCNKSAGPLSNNTNNNNNNNSNNNNGGNTAGTPTPRGVPTGPLVSKFIPAGGGSIATPDGKIELVIPNGALPSGDTITIMNITNFAPGGVADSYEFLPDGLKFSTPVTIKYHYDSSDMRGTSPLVSCIAYQDTAAVWRGLRNSTIDTSNHIVSVTTTHFTSYSLVTSIFLAPVPGGDLKNHQLMVNKTNNWDIMYIQASDPHASSSPASGDEELLTAPAPLLPTADNIDGWSVDGVTNGNSVYGTVIPNGTSCNYTAPAQVPSTGNPVDLSVKIKNFPFTAHVNTNGVTSTVTFHDLRLDDAFTIISNDLTYDVSINYNNTLVDGGAGFVFGATDNADLTVEVKDGTNVTVTVNSNGTTSVVPAFQGDNNCKSTWTGIGEVMNISSGSGTVVDAGSDQPAIVQLTFKGANITEPSFVLSGSSCSGTAGGQALVGDGPPGDFSFKLDAGTQYPAVLDPSITVVVKPKN